MTNSILIKSLSHPHVKHLVKLRTQKGYRQEQGRVVVVTEKVIREVAPHGKIHRLLLPQGSEKFAGMGTFAAPNVLKKASGLTTTNDWVAEIELPKAQSLENSKRLLVLDRVSDPGNQGTLIRTALGLGWDGVYFLKGGVDPFNDKTLRASRAALFCLPYRIGDEIELTTLLANRCVYVADAGGKPVENSMATVPVALIVGNEASGPKKDLARQYPLISVPMPGEMESLNVAVAGAILIYALSYA